MAPIPQSLDTDKEVTVEIRRVSPSHFLVNIESFSVLSKSNVEMYQTTEFETGECKWKLVIYPNGLESGENCEHVSVFLALADSTTLPEYWEVNAVFAIFLHNQKTDNFLFKQGGLCRFHALNHCWGFSKFIPKKSLMDPSNGYLVKDNCTFGAEVFVIKSQGVVIGRLMSQAETSYKQTWRIPLFSKLPDAWLSEIFYVGEHKWKLVLHPRGIGAGKDSCASHCFWNSLNSNILLKTYMLVTECKSMTLSTANTVHKPAINKWFESCQMWGLPEFMPLKYMKDPEKGFLVDDCCVVEIEMTMLD